MSCVGKNRVKNNIFTYELDMLLELRTEQTGMEDIMKKSVVVNMHGSKTDRTFSAEGKSVFKPDLYGIC
jgi:hypothetical protein